MAQIEAGSPDNWDLIGYQSSEGADNLNKKLLPYMKVLKNCGTESGCLQKTNYLELDGKSEYYNNNQHKQYARFLLADGSVWTSYIYSADCTYNFGSSKQLNHVCGEFEIDINGHKSPNTIGRDYFTFYVTKYGIVPAGSADETTPFKFTNACVKDKGHIKNWGANGIGCAAWVVYKENMDYLKCTGLSWDGPSTCKELNNK